MTLDEKLQTINTPAISDTLGPMPQGYADTVKEFFENFILPRLPQKDVIVKWHRLLMDYVKDESSLSCCVRYGNSGSNTTSRQGETGYKKLRRGWLTKNTNDDFEYFFADNFFSSFIYKMAIDGFVPDIKEFHDSFRSHNFPYGFGYMVDNKKEEYKGVVIAKAKSPGFLSFYKLSHVFDAGNIFRIRNQCFNDSSLSTLYYDIGSQSDFLNNSDKIRRMEITPEAKKVIIAKFLRFAHPMNYFLSPSKRCHYCTSKVYRNDIGEDPFLIDYVKQYLQKTYPKEYSEFKSKILWDDSAELYQKATGNEIIGITYGPSLSSKIISNKVSTPKIHNRSSYSPDRLKVAKHFLEHNDSLIKIELSVMNLPVDRHGSAAKYILDSMGIVNEKKGVLLGHDIHTELANAKGIYADTLRELIKFFGM